MWSLCLAVLITTCSDSLMLIITKSLGFPLMSDIPLVMKARCPQPLSSLH